MRWRSLNGRHAKSSSLFKKRIEENAKIPQRARLAIELLDALSVAMRNPDPEEEPWTQIHLN
ncbi:MAG: hypothetical protein H3C52_13240 [Anaerolineales bacterium]|jgi:hypothetical protein|nr:hypothetical protein [Anaerolineales bacterium]MCZ2287355.1 hypothetical protein [Anaerolineales bacterium]RIK27866.1 MAG: hypothetical protein DCC54_01580 [Anaerolineae bacterium]